MGDRGPKPKYTPEQAALLGNPGRRPLDVPGDDEPAEETNRPDVLTYIPDPPDWLTGTSGVIGLHAVTAWRTLAQVMVDARQLREGDQIALGRYCRYVAEWVQMTAEIDDMGMIVIDEGPKGGTTTKANPLLRARASNETAIAALERELGLNPKARIEVQKRIMQHVKDLPLLGSNRKQKQSGPIGFLTRDDDE